MNNIDFFKSQAKFLQKDYNKNIYEALYRFKKIFHSKENPTLMNFHHVIAREACFENWNTLIKASSSQLSIAKVLYENPTLNFNGIQFDFSEMIKKSKMEKIKFINEQRKRLLNNADFIMQLSQFLQDNIERTATIRSYFSSYNIKHIIERSLSKYGFYEDYVSNGELITAAILAGFKFSQNSQHSGFNVYFNMSQKSLKRMPGYR